MPDLVMFREGGWWRILWAELVWDPACQACLGSGGYAGDIDPGRLGRRDRRPGLWVPVMSYSEIDDI